MGIGDGTALPMPFDQIQSPNLSAWRGEPGAAGWRTVLASIEFEAALPDEGR
jgi:hypothetical protein